MSLDSYSFKKHHNCSQEAVVKTVFHDANFPLMAELPGQNQPTKYDSMAFIFFEITYFCSLYHACKVSNSLHTCKCPLKTK